MIFFIAPAKTFAETTKKAKTKTTLQKESEKIVQTLQEMTEEEITKLMKINEKLGRLNYQRYQEFDFEKEAQPAIFAYYGIQYKALEANDLTEEEIHYLDNHLRILSGLYGSIRPLDAIKPYRLEMNTKLEVDNKKNLYEYWGDKIYKELEKNAEKTYVNLASTEYSKCIKKYLKPDEIFITCSFKINKDGKLKTTATPAKQARGKMVKYLAQNQVKDYEKIKEFNIDGYKYRPELSQETGQIKEYVFVKED